MNKETDKKTLRWGILGAGDIARKFARSARVVPQAEVQAVASNTSGKAQAMAKEWKIPTAYDSYEALVQDPNIDLVYVANTHNFHHAAVLLALRAGKGVLCEKPLAMNAGEAGEMIDQARQSELFLMEAMWSRFLPVFRQSREWVAAGEIGEVRQVQASFGVPVTPEQRSRVFDPALAGGALLDLGIYPLALASMLAGGKAPEEMVSLVEKGPTGVDHTCSLQLRYPKALQASLLASVDYRASNIAEIVGTRGKIHLPDLFMCAQEVTLIRDGERITRAFPEPPEETFRHEIEEVQRCWWAGEKESPEMPLDETLQLAKTMDAFRAQWGLRYPGE